MRTFPFLNQEGICQVISQEYTENAIGSYFKAVSICAR